MVWPTPTARRNETFMLFAYPTGAVGNVVSKGVNELIIPNYKQTWGEYPETRGCAAGNPPPIVQERGIWRLNLGARTMENSETRQL